VKWRSSAITNLIDKKSISPLQFDVNFNVKETKTMKRPTLKSRRNIKWQQVAFVCIVITQIFSLVASQIVPDLGAVATKDECPHCNALEEVSWRQ